MSGLGDLYKPLRFRDRPRMGENLWETKTYAVSGLWERIERIMQVGTAHKRSHRLKPAPGMENRLKPGFEGGGERGD